MLFNISLLQDWLLLPQWQFDSLKYNKLFYQNSLLHMGFSQSASISPIVMLVGDLVAENN
jgi:hypothetical protein